MIASRRRCLARLLPAAAALLAAAPGLAAAQGAAHPPPQVELHATAIAAGVGFVIGDGMLTFQGRTHGFSISGFSVVDVGVAGLTAQGSVEGLRELSQFGGNYVAFEAGATAAGGAGLLAMRNQNGVVLRLQATSRGARLALAPEGLLIRLR